MRIRKYTLCWSTALLAGAVLLGGCDVITAQNITDSSGSGMNGGGTGMNGGPGRNGGGMRGMMNADVMGKVISVNGSTLKIELLEQTRSRDQSRTGDRNARPDTDGQSADGTSSANSTAPAPTNSSDPSNPSNTGNAGNTDHAGNAGTDQGTGAGQPLPGGTSPGRQMEMNSTGEEKTLQISGDVQISEGPGMMPQLNAADSKTNSATSAMESTLKLSDLKAGETVMIWYKENTGTVERIMVM
ncbi:hypothetical protein [Paenibacillus sp. Z6-24]